MQQKIKPLLVIACSFLFLLLSCNTHKHSEKEIVQAMQHYDALILQLNPDSISMLYAADGNLGDIAKGRDSIRKFLSSFKNIQVLSQASSTDSIKITGDTAIQNGTYKQTDVISLKDTVSVLGAYTARWEWNAKDGWLIKRMVTKPTN